MWVSCSSHRARQRLYQIAGKRLQEYGRWPRGARPRGSYYLVSDNLREQVERIKGLRILSREPKDLFKRITFGS